MDVQTVDFMDERSVCLSDLHLPISGCPNHLSGPSQSASCLSPIYICVILYPTIHLLTRSSSSLHQQKKHIYMDRKRLPSTPSLRSKRSGKQRASILQDEKVAKMAMRNDASRMKNDGRSKSWSIGVDRFLEHLKHSPLFSGPVSGAGRCETALMAAAGKISAALFCGAIDRCRNNTLDVLGQSVYTFCPCGSHLFSTPAINATFQRDHVGGPPSAGAKLWPNMMNTHKYQNSIDFKL